MITWIQLNHMTTVDKRRKFYVQTKPVNVCVVVVVTIERTVKKKTEEEEQRQQKELTNICHSLVMMVNWIAVRSKIPSPRLWLVRPQSLKNPWSGNIVRLVFCCFERNKIGIIWVSHSQLEVGFGQPNHCLRASVVVELVGDRSRKRHYWDEVQSSVAVNITDRSCGDKGRATQIW